MAERHASNFKFMPETFGIQLTEISIAVVSVDLFLDVLQ